MKAFHGQPIKPNVEKLLEAFKPKPGNVFLHQDIAQASGVAYRSSRYGALIAAWKRELLNSANIDLDSVQGIGYRCLEDNERVRVGINDVRHSIRKLGRSADRIARADTSKLDDVHRRQQDHANRLLQSVIDSGRKASRQIAVSGRVVLLPRKEAGSKDG